MATNGNTPTARKPHRDFAGYVTERRNPLTGDHNIVIDLKNGGEWAGSVEDGGRWLTLCNKHSTLVQSTNLDGARGAMLDATSFCDDCREIEAARKKTAAPPRPGAPGNKRDEAMEAISKVRATLPESCDASAYLLDAFRLVGRDMMNDELALELVVDAGKAKGPAPSAEDVARLQQAIRDAMQAQEPEDEEQEEDE